jgi:hypothetical protein
VSIIALGSCAAPEEGDREDDTPETVAPSENVDEVAPEIGRSEAALVAGGVIKKGWGSRSKCTNPVRYGHIDYDLRDFDKYAGAFALLAVDYEVCTNKSQQVVYASQVLSVSGALLSANAQAGEFFKNNSYDLQYKFNLVVSFKIPKVGDVGKIEVPTQIGYSGRYGYAHVCVKSKCTKGRESK